MTRSAIYILALAGIVALIYIMVLFKNTPPTPSLIELQGKVSVVISDNFEKKQSTNEYFLETSSGRYQLLFKNPPNIEPGSTIKVTGILENHTLKIEN